MVESEITRDEHPHKFQETQNKYKFNIAYQGVLCFVTLSFFLKLKDL